ncbi:hypothetical protein DYBT9275_02378 [Dyadobacter sp. CECT 9275]|uniref:Immunity protein 49 n=1 Tax=Dyadobacter helix TaxID=2822344 RepID=A0A916JE07_9BACT|nr:Imm49 family immunity protein [Dyadobacter sp. CECT 9275]CAG5000072.1 hypothetical protein DYBT9275_02378 [Dyadobacter sp. CECT 9275]
MKINDELSERISKRVRHIEEIAMPQINRIINEKPFEFDRLTYGIWFNHEMIGLYNLFVAENIDEAKKEFYICGTLTNYNTLRFGYFNEEIPYISAIDNVDFMSFIDHFSYVLLSDSPELIEQFSQLHHQWWEKKLSTGYLVLASSVQFVLRDDWEGLEKNMFYFDKLIKKAKKIQYDKDFFVALMENNEAKVTAAIETLCSKKIHQYNNDFPIKEEIISFPSVGYAKLAWLKGMKVQINNPLVPMELMPVQPLEHYENPYKHLWRLGETDGGS